MIFLETKKTHTKNTHKKNNTKNKQTATTTPEQQEQPVTQLRNSIFVSLYISNQYA